MANPTSHSTHVTVDKNSLENTIAKDANGNVIVKDENLKKLLDQSISKAKDPATQSVKVGVSVDF